VVLVSYLALIELPVRGAVVARWNFNSPVSDGDPTTGTFLPSRGAGVTSLLGGVTGSFTASNGSSDPDTEDSSNWRITNWPAQGTQNKQHGVRFDVPTVGWRNLRLTWNQRHSNTASKYARLQYTTNGIDFRDWRLITMPAESWANVLTASLEVLPGVENNRRFGFRFVAEFEDSATGTGLHGYVPSNPASSYGSAGTLRLDMVTLSGDPSVQALSVVTYNVLGRDVADWTTNSAQVKAIGRQLSYLNPDIVGFQEIPETNSNYLLMASFITAYLPDYFLATGIRTDGGERSVIASRFPILRSQSWLSRSALAGFGYSGVFTRDLFEVQVEVPGFNQPLHFFTTHLKAFGDEASATRRGAEARAISNFFARVYLSTNALHPYVLVGDMNEDLYRPRTYEQNAIKTLANAATGLCTNTPRNPVTGDDRTWSIQNANLSIRFDYVLPCGLLSSNLISSQVFRSDRVHPMVPPLLVGDSATSSDHLPVMMSFRNPYEVPATIQSFSRSNGLLRLTWRTVPGAHYQVETSYDLSTWTVLLNNIMATTEQYPFEFSTMGVPQFFRLARGD
jgi:endonuclease/exonuclease/phosphatase family metal-dependent hydrolase